MRGLNATIIAQSRIRHGKVNGKTNVKRMESRGEILRIVAMLFEVDEFNGSCSDMRTRALYIRAWFV